jgi:hypothetical protein
MQERPPSLLPLYSRGMTEKRSRAVARDSAVHPDYTRLPEPTDLSATVETHDPDGAVHEPESPFATPDIADMARTGAIGGGF